MSGTIQQAWSQKQAEGQSWHATYPIGDIFIDLPHLHGHFVHAALTPLVVSSLLMERAP
ncbi:hypothetical protein [Longimicrobium terrae]|uniref:hypothetical protein n=1 Tax=Longimicrobium terrae TaxID=1639882 RepID=UPI001472C155|nr:hypothetical protein [Longimicrobium terrae]NNC31362.1 hypothetical protein [Longimicrobium terrae]